MTGGATIRLRGHLPRDGAWYDAVKRACLLFYSNQGVCSICQYYQCIVKEVFLGNGLKRIQDSELAERLRTGTLCMIWRKQRLLLDQDTDGH